MSAPERPACPACGQGASLLLILEQRAACGNEECWVLMWEVGMTHEQLLKMMQDLDPGKRS